MNQSLAPRPCVGRLLRRTSTCGVASRCRGVMTALFALAPAVLGGQSAPGRQAVAAPVVHGEVLAQDGRPIAGAVVRVVRWTLGTLPAPMTLRLDDPQVEVARFTTDDQGRFRGAVPEGELLVAHGEHPTGGMSAPLGGFGPGDTLVLRLLPVRRLQGKVLLRQGGGTVPAVDHLVWHQVVPRNLHRETPVAGMRMFRRFTRTGADGSYQLDVPDEGGAPSVACVRLAGQLACGLDITQGQEPQRVACTLVDRSTGKPVAGARLLPAWGNGIVPAVSDASGRIETLAADSGSGQVVPQAHRRVVLPDGLKPAHDPVPSRIVLEAGLPLRARLLRADGTPVANARVLLNSAIREPDRGWGGIEWPEQTDADGRLTVGCLQRGQCATAFVEVDGGWQMFLSTMPNAYNDLGDVTVTGSLRIEGRVVGPDGAPVAGAEILLLPPRIGAAAPAFPPPVRTVVANRLGQFAVPGLFAGVWSLAARARSLGIATATCAGSTPCPIQLTLPAAATVSGRVLDPEGRGVARAAVRASLDRGVVRGTLSRFGLAEFQAETDAAGRFTIQGLPDNTTLQIEAQVDGGGTVLSAELLNVTAGSSDLELVLRGH